MKKLLILTMALALCFSVSNAFAQPFTGTMAADGYDSTPGDGVPTPDDTGNVFFPEPVSTTDKDVYDIHDAVNLLLTFDDDAVNPIYENNSQIDEFQVTTGDNVWTDLNSDEALGEYIFIGISAGNTNTLGVYDVATETPTNVIKPDPDGGYTGFGFSGDGTEGDPFPAYLSPISAGTDFGWYLKTVNGTTNTWYSDPSLNVLQDYDHMLTYSLSQLADDEVYIAYGCTATNVNDLPSDPCYDDAEPYAFNNPYLIVWEDKPYASGTLGDEDYNDMMFLVDRVVPVPTVPEPASMALLGTGLLGLFGFRRKRS